MVVLLSNNRNFVKGVRAVAPLEMLLMGVKLFIAVLLCAAIFRVWSLVCEFLKSLIKRVFRATRPNR